MSHPKTSGDKRRFYLKLSTLKKEAETSEARGIRWIFIENINYNNYTLFCHFLMKVMFLKSGFVCMFIHWKTVSEPLKVELLENSRALKKNRCV